MPLDREAPVDFDPQTKLKSNAFAQFEPSQPFPPLEEDVESEPERGFGFARDDGDGGIEREEGKGGEDAEYTFESSIGTGPSTSTVSFPSESEDDEEDEEDEDGEGDDPHNENTRIGLNPPFFRSTASLPVPGSGPNPNHNAFAPPFYNRPPTPLPPSPSLTSLLRPSFSATTSRPTTPDTSENETPNDTEAAVAKSARNATTVPRASPKVPTYEYYGFVLYLASSLAFCKSFRDLWDYHDYDAD